MGGKQRHEDKRDAWHSPARRGGGLAGNWFASQLPATRLLRRSIRIRSHAASGYYLLASLWWEQARYSEAIEVVRFADSETE